jgi:GxxExxY protein
MAYDQGTRSGGYGHGRTPSTGGNQRGSGRGRRPGIPLSAFDAATTESSRKLIGAAIEVHRTLGPGHDPTTYINALKLELAGLGVRTSEGHRVPVMYKDRKVGESTADLFIDNCFFVEVLSRSGPVNTTERLSLRAKLKAQDLELGLIINFAEKRLTDGVVRVVNIDKLTKEKGLSLRDPEGDHTDHADSGDHADHSDHEFREPA